MIEPLVSVKMITYNHRPYIGRAIEGVLQQKRDFPIELVIGEDCSTDGTREIVFGYQKKHPDVIRVITSDQNVGMKKNGFRTTKACRGKYIAFCEGDDYWHNPNKLQTQVNYLECHLDCGLVYSSYDVYHVKTKRTINDFIKYRKWEMPVNPSISEIVGGENGLGLGILTCTIMLRRHLYKRVIESDPYLHISENFLMGDTQVWAEISNIAKIHFLPESLATHIITEESATRSKDIRKILRFQKSRAEMIIYLCNKHKLPEEIRNNVGEQLNDINLRLAFYLRSAKLADEVRKEKKILTLREMARFWGAKFGIAYYAYRCVSRVLQIIRKEKSDWI